MDTVSRSEQETRKQGITFAKQVKPGMVVALHGGLGSGKTTFIQGVLQGLGISQRVTSPTFVLLKMYLTPASISVFHLDLYRTEPGQDLRSLGLSDILGNDKGIVFIEWPGNISDTLPNNTVHITFTMQGETGREINVKGL